MWRSFAESLSFEGIDESVYKDAVIIQEERGEHPSWGEDVGDSCCFGIRTVAGGDWMRDDCIWRLHGGV